MSWLEVTWDIITSNLAAVWEQIRHMGLAPSFINNTVFSPFLGLTTVITLIISITVVLRIWSMFHGNM